MVEYAKGVKGEIDQRPRRFYSEVSVAPHEAGHAVLVDGKMLRTPEKKAMAFPAEALARVVADEWAAQVDRIDLQSMFNTRLANVAIDRTPAARAELAEEAARYTATDLVSHLADGPAVLRDRQEAGWAPLRAWAAETHGVKLTPVTGIIAAPQPPASAEAMRAHAATLDDFRLTGLVHAIALFGSAVLGLAAERRRITAAEAFELSRIDEAYQAGQWGEDAEAARFAERNRAEARALDRWFDSLSL